MPKIRDHKRPPQVAFLVSPWQTKAPPPADASTPPAAAKDAPCMYSVMTTDALLSSSPAPLPSEGTPDYAAATTKPVASLSSATLTSSGWHTRQQHPTRAPPTPAAAAMQQQQQQHIPHPSATLFPASPQAAGSTPDMSADETEAEDASSQPASASDASDADEDDWLAADAADVSAGPSTPPTSTTTTTTLQGVAQLVLHPSGAISGHFVALNTPSQPDTTSRPNSTQTAAGAPSRQPDSTPTTTNSSSSSSSSRSKALCLGLQGRQVLGIHSCYRDPEWALLQLSVMRYSNSADTGASAVATAVTAGLLPAWSSGPAADPDAAAAAAAAGQAADAFSVGGVAGGSSSVQAEAVAWVQRKGGDLVTLEPADFDDEDTEAAVMADNLGELPDNPIVNFTAHTLLCGVAAAGVLQKTWPELLGQADEVVVNLGDMSIARLPVGFLAGS